MQLFTKNLALLLCLPLAALAIGCGTTATVTTRGYTAPVEGKITRSTSDTVYVETAAGNETSIDRSQITDIDHPGNVAATIGGIVSAYGVANIITGLPQCDRQGPAFCTGVFLPAAIGLPLTIWGAVTWGQSKSAANASTSGTGARMTVVPIANFDKKNQIYGASALVSF